MWDFSLSDALRAVIRTAPFVLLRLVVYVGMAFGFVLITALGAGFGLIAGRMLSLPNGALWGGLGGFVLLIGLYRLAREYVLYLVKAGHIAVLVELIDGKSIPAGEGQLRHGANYVRAHFAQSSVLFGVDLLIKAVIRTLTNLANRLSSFVPIPGLAPLLKIAEAVMRLSLTYVDELILAYLIRSRSQNPWETAKEGLVLYAQNYTHFLKNALWLWLILWAITLSIFALCLAPAIVFAAALPGHHGWWGIGFAFVFAWALKIAVLEPLAIAALMQVFFRKIEGQRPDPAWEARLNATSAKFRELGEKAAGWIDRPAAGAANTPDVRPA
ncbi:MAG TPA: hypothetical protein VL026_00210 [Rhizomicrobium sp.]|nr:hypothetical protein [Rhizomicrobium sp.]